MISATPTSDVDFDGLSCNIKTKSDKSSVCAPQFQNLSPSVNQCRPYPVQLFSKAAFTKVIHTASSGIENNYQSQLTNKQTEEKDITKQHQTFDSNRLIKLEVPEEPGIVKFVKSEFGDDQAIKDGKKQNVPTYPHFPKEIKDELSNQNLSNTGHLSSHVGLNVLNEKKQNMVISKSTSASSYMMMHPDIQSQKTSLPVTAKFETVSTVSGNLPLDAILEIPDTKPNTSKVKPRMVIKSQEIVNVSIPSLLSFGHLGGHKQLLTPGKYLIKPSMFTCSKMSQPSTTTHTTASVGSEQKPTLTGMKPKIVPYVAPTGSATSLAKTSKSIDLSSKSYQPMKMASSQSSIVFAGKPLDTPVYLPKKQFSVGSCSSTVTCTTNVAVMSSVTVTASTAAMSPITAITFATCPTGSCIGSVNNILPNVNSENSNVSRLPSNTLLANLPETVRVVPQSNTQYKRVCKSGILDSLARKCTVNPFIKTASTAACGIRQIDSVSEIDKLNSTSEIAYHDTITENKKLKKCMLVPIKDANMQMISHESSQGSIKTGAISFQKPLRKCTMKQLIQNQRSNSKSEIPYKNTITKDKKSNKLLVPFKDANVETKSHDLRWDNIISDKDSLKTLVSQNDKSQLKISSVFSMANERNVFEDGEKSVQSFINKKENKTHNHARGRLLVNNLNVRRKLKRYLLQSQIKVKTKQELESPCIEDRCVKQEIEPQSTVCDLDKKNPSCLFLKLPQGVSMDCKLLQRPFVVVERLKFSRYNRLLSSSLACNKICRQRFLRNLLKKKTIHRKLNKDVLSSISNTSFGVTKSSVSTSATTCFSSSSLLPSRENTCSKSQESGLTQTVFRSRLNDPLSNTSTDNLMFVLNMKGNLSSSGNHESQTPKIIQHFNSGTPGSMTKVSNASSSNKVKGITWMPEVVGLPVCCTATTNSGIGTTINQGQSSIVRSLTIPPQFVKSSTGSNILSKSQTVTNDKIKSNVKVFPCSLANDAPTYFLASLDKIDSSTTKGSTSISIKLIPVQFKERTSECGNVTSSCRNKSQLQSSTKNTIVHSSDEKNTQPSSLKTLSALTLTSPQSSTSIGKGIVLSLRPPTTDNTVPTKSEDRSIQPPLLAMLTRSTSSSAQSSSCIGKTRAPSLKQLSMISPSTIERTVQHSSLTVLSTSKQTPAQPLTIRALPSKSSTQHESSYTEDLIHTQLAKTRSVCSDTQASLQQTTFSERSSERGPATKFKKIQMHSIVKSKVNKGTKYYFTGDGLKIKTEPMEVTESEPLIEAVKRPSTVESQGDPGKTAPQTKLYIRESNGQMTPVSSVIESNVNKGTMYYFVPGGVMIKPEPVTPGEVTEVTGSEPLMKAVKTLKTIESREVFRKTESKIDNRKRRGEDDIMFVRKRVRGNEVGDTKNESNEAKLINCNLLDRFPPLNSRSASHEKYGKTSDFVKKERLKNLREFVQMKKKNITKFVFQSPCDSTRISDPRKQF